MQCINRANSRGTLIGGYVLEWIDQLLIITCLKHWLKKNEKDDSCMAATEQLLDSLLDSLLD